MNLGDLVALGLIGAGTAVMVMVWIACARI
jgi:hypothetical protein